MITVILLALTALFFIILGIGIALLLVRREMYRIISETRTFLIEKIFEERNTIERQIEVIQRPTMDESMAELMAEYKKFISAATEKVQKGSIPTPPAE